jgi:lysozyme family protein
MIFADWFKSLFKKPVFDNEPKVEVKPQEPFKEPAVDLGSAKFPNWQNLWSSCVIDKERTAEIEKVCKKILDNKDKYLIVEIKTGVPWYLVAALHYREASLNFKTCLHNGDPLPGPTRHVPKGRGPFKDWETAAIDALIYDGLDHVKLETVTSCLVMAEKFNGIGYHSKGIYSPYVWAGTNHSTERGKYVSDGYYSPTAREEQLGVAAIFKGLGIS